MEQQKYSFNYSQDIVNLQTKYSLFKRVANIVFSITFENGFDKSIMEQALQLLIERNDCLRITFVKEGKQTKQYFVPSRKLGKIPSWNLDTPKLLDSFVKNLRKSAVNVYKGETLVPHFVTGPSGEDMLFVKISHMVADTYGIGVLVNDLQAIYNALKNNSELPPAPGKFEDILRKDQEYRANDNSTEKDREFFQNYYGKKPTNPIYCGIHGNTSDRWLKYKRKGHISLPYLFVKCDTEGYRFVIPAAVTEKAAAWCEEKKISMSTFFFYTCSLAASLRNDKAPYQLPLELMNCRATVLDRKAAGTKVQSLSTYVTVDYTKSFDENIAQLFEEQSELYKHTKLTYLEIEAMQHKLWNYSMISQITNFSFSFIPMSMPDGISMQVYSNGKGALAAYIALMLNVKTNEIYVNYDIQTQMCSARELVEFQNIYLRVIETVIAKSDVPLNDIF